MKIQGTRRNAMHLYIFENRESLKDIAGIISNEINMRRYAIEKQKT